MTADGSIIIETEIDDKKAQQELNRLNRRIQNLNDQIYVKRQQQMPLVEQARQLGAELDAAKAKLDSMQSGREFNTSSSIDTQAQRVKQLEKEWSDVQRRVESYDDQIQKANISLGLAKEQAGQSNSSLPPQVLAVKLWQTLWIEWGKVPIGFPCDCVKLSEAP